MWACFRRVLYCSKRVAYAVRPRDAFDVQTMVCIFLRNVTRCVMNDMTPLTWAWLGGQPNQRRRFLFGTLYHGHDECAQPAWPKNLSDSENAMLSHAAPSVGTHKLPYRHHIMTFNLTYCSSMASS